MGPQHLSRNQSLLSTLVLRAQVRSGAKVANIAKMQEILHAGVTHAVLEVAGGAAISPESVRGSWIQTPADCTASHACYLRYNFALPLEGCCTKTIARDRLQGFLSATPN